MNRRLALDLYLWVVPITGSPTSPEIERPGVRFEFAVKMKQFFAEQEIHHYSADDKKAEKCIFLLANTIATFHSKIEKAEEGSPMEARTSC